MILLSGCPPVCPSVCDYVTLPALERNMKGTLLKFNSKVVPLSDEGITYVDTGHCRLLNSYKAGITSGISDVCHTTLRRASVQLSKPSDATHSARPVGQSGRGHRLPQPGQLTIGEELLGYHNNNNYYFKEEDNQIKVKR